MKVRFLPLAKEELDAAVAYYRAINPILSRAFRAEAREIRDRIARNPEAWHPIEKPFRRCRFHRFPYAFIYEARATEVIVVAVAPCGESPVTGTSG
ncbi:MAG: type II toxin-antitoxin system RelE/ParE family toxin [Rhodocyclales bacterium]|nr:type II toxin-antitoxin system RelE/ParE family toxin [Rhodocyclales bacterium]